MSRTPESPSPTYPRIYAIIKRIPRGRVATYSQIAALAGLGSHARQVGYALAATPDNLPLPWHRVINARGEISRRSESGEENEQRNLLESEGIQFGDKEKISLAKYKWRPGIP